MEKIMGAFGARVKALRKERKMRQVDMAELLDCTDRHYQRMEYGDINIPSLTLIKLADYFNVSTDYLLGRSDVR
ncbi:MAG: helix-turn-helix transcriptional regulator [Oscillospiraceae bacterium]|nr:helix-turn-helix transcriptional regulator [Oscillospiraceae bacterium]